MSAGPMTEVSLTISCKNLRDADKTSKSDPMCVLFLQNFGSNEWTQVGTTERLENTHDPEFHTKFPLQYYFEQSQRLKFEVYDCDSDKAQLKDHDFLGRLELTLGELMSSPGSSVHRALTGTSKGSIIILGEDVANQQEFATITFHAHKLDNKDTFGKSDPFFMIYRRNTDATRTLAYRSETLKNDLNPKWKQFKVPIQALCQNVKDRPFDVEVYDYDNDGRQAHDLIGVCELTVAQLISGAILEMPLINPKKKAKKSSYKNSGVLLLKGCKVQVEHSFLDYVRGGTELHSTVAVDFTASNGNPQNKESLHFIHPYEPNQYTMGLQAVGEIIQDYDSNKMFPALGFGAKLPDGQVSHEFFLNGHPTDPTCVGVDGVLSAYRQAIMRYQLYGPTNFSPGIYHVAKFAAASAKDHGGAHYFVLLIITDGIISDIEQTKAAIVYASALPMSIIIVGVGNEDFTAMDVLDSDKTKLVSNGKTVERDIVQFVPMRDYAAQSWQMQQARLAQAVLAEVPRQLTEYMTARNIQPLPRRQVIPGNLPVQPTPNVPAGQGGMQPMPAGQGGMQPMPAGQGGMQPMPAGQGDMQQAGYPALK